MRKKWILTALLVLLLFIALLQLDPQSLISSIRQIPLWTVLLLFAMQIVSQVLVNIQWCQVAKLAGTPIRFRDMLYINSQGTVMDCITPGVKIGGEITRAVQISRTANCPGEQSAAIVVLQKLFSISALFSILLFAVGYLIGEAPMLQTVFLQVLIYGVLALFLLLFAGLFLVPHRIKARLQAKSPSRFSWVRRVQSFLIILTDHVSVIRKNKKAWVMLSLLSLLIWLLYPVKMFILTLQLAPDVNLFYIGAITFVSYMVASFPIFPGGLGGFEGTMTGLLVLAELAVSDAAVITIFFRFVTFWFVLLLSLVYIAFYKRGSRHLLPTSCPFMLK